MCVCDCVYVYTYIRYIRKLTCFFDNCDYMTTIIILTEATNNHFIDTNYMQVYVIIVDFSFKI